MAVCQFRSHPATLGSDNESFLDQKRLIYFFQGACIFTHGSSQGTDSHRASLECKDKRSENLVVYGIQAPLVYLQFVWE